MWCLSRVKVVEGRDTCSAEPLWQSQAGEMDGAGVVQRWFHVRMVKGGDVGTCLCDRWERIGRWWQEMEECPDSAEPLWLSKAR